MNEPITELSRINFFHGRLLSADDLAHEQQQARARQWLHNRLLHGHGVVTGLEVTVVGDHVEVAPGVALDPLGREIVLGDTRRLDGADVVPETHGRVQVVIAWAEKPAGDMPGPGGPVPDRFVECPLVTLADHTLDEPPEHGLPLARLYRRGAELLVDPSVRRHAHR